MKMMKLDRQKIEIIAIAVLVFIFVVLFAGMLGKHSKPKAARQASRAVPKAADMKIGPEAKGPDPAFGEEQRWGRNPFTLVRSDVGERTRGNLVLHGIIWDEAKPCAIINGIVVSCGEKVGGCTVISIEKNNVTMDDGTSQYKLKLWE